jgi:hypothetical protein
MESHDKGKVLEKQAPDKSKQITKLKQANNFPGQNNSSERANIKASIPKRKNITTNEISISYPH